MADRHKYDKLGWAPVNEINKWVRAVADRNHMPIADVLNLMAREYIANHDPAYYENCLAPNMSASIDLADKAPDDNE